MERGEKAAVAYEAPHEEVDLTECGILSCRPSLIQQFANIKVVILLYKIRYFDDLSSWPQYMAEKR